MVGEGSVRSIRTQGRVHLTLLDGFGLTLDQQPTPVPFGVQRLLAYMALHDGPVSRARVSAHLWLDSPEDRAQANLRSALWRLGRSGIPVIRSEGDVLRLVEDVTVDTRDLITQARRLVHPDGEAELTTIDEHALTGELLPDWYDDWVLLERERLRQLCLHALEVLARALLADGQYGRAVEAAFAAVRGEPLRESAQRTLIAIHLAERNTSEAIRQYRRYRRMLADELGVEPSESLTRLVAPLTRP